MWCCGLYSLLKCLKKRKSRDPRKWILSNPVPRIAASLLASSARRKPARFRAGLSPGSTYKTMQPLSRTEYYLRFGGGTSSDEMRGALAASNIVIISSTRKCNRLSGDPMWSYSPLAPFLGMEVTCGRRILSSDVTMAGRDRRPAKKCPTIAGISGSDSKDNPYSASRFWSALLRLRGGILIWTLKVRSAHNENSTGDRQRTF